MTSRRGSLTASAPQAFWGTVGTAMSYLEAFIYGAVQGVTEYLPVSSSAHLILLPKFLGTTDPGLAFDVFLHLGTLLATLGYFWRDWLAVISDPRGGRKGGVPLSHLVVATLPALAAGAALHSWVETAFRGPGVIVVTLVLGGAALFGADRLFRRDRSLARMGWKDALGVGIAQCFALVPGVSRSGSTMIGARLLGFDREASARFSFLISAPVTAAAIVFELRKWDGLAAGPVGAGPLVVACLASFAFGWLAIGGLLRLLRRFGYLSFFVYRSALAAVVYAMFV